MDVLDKREAELPDIERNCLVVVLNDNRDQAEMLRHLTGGARAMEAVLRGLTFELTGRQQRVARPGLAKMHREPPDRAWWPAVGASVERGVRHRRGHVP